MDSSEEDFDDSPDGSIEDSVVEDFESYLENSVVGELGDISESSLEDIPTVGDVDSPSLQAIEDSHDDQDQYNSEQDHGSIAETPEGSVIEDSEGDLRDSGNHGHDSTDDLDLDIADGISSSSIPDDIDLEEVFLRAAGEDSPIPEWVLNDTRAQAMRLTRRGEASASRSRPDSSQATQEQENAHPRTSQTATLKRSRSSEAGDIPGPSSAAGPSSSTLPPISSLLESIGGSSRSSQASGQRPGVSPKRPRREDPIDLDDLFGSDDEGVEVVNLINVDRPRATQDEPETKPNAGAEAEAGAEPEPEPEPETEPEPASLVRLSGLQCVICMDDMSNLTVTHCGHLFCGECLHSSLTMGFDRRICPICRTKLELRVDGMSAAKQSRSYFPLLVKTRSANRQGKQPVRS